MAGATISALSDMLKSIYLGPARIEAVKVTAWTCSKHHHPVRDVYEEVCLAAEALGTECEDLYECPHVVSRKVKDGCSECKTSSYEAVIDYSTLWIEDDGTLHGDPVYVAKLFTTMEWELNQPLLLSELLEEGKHQVKVVLGKSLPQTDAAREANG
jgi:hypothetical protein